MGRRYYGNIEGKFAFGIQSSHSPERFGLEPAEQRVIEYYADKDNLAEIEDELKRIEDKVGDKIKKIDDFFLEKDSYSDSEIGKLLGIEFEETRNTDKNGEIKEINMLTSWNNQGKQELEVKRVLEEYFDYKLGCQIRDCIREKGSCGFEAEL